MEPELSKAAVSTSTPKQAVINGQSGSSAVQGQLSEGQCETQLLIASHRTARAAITQRQSLLELHTVTLIKLSMAMKFCRTAQELRPAAARTVSRDTAGTSSLRAARAQQLLRRSSPCNAGEQGRGRSQAPASQTASRPSLQLHQQHVKYYWLKNLGINFKVFINWLIFRQAECFVSLVVC